MKKFKYKIKIMKIEINYKENKAYNKKIFFKY